MNTLTVDTTDFSEIVEGLWLSSMFSVKPLELYKRGITHVVSVMKNSTHILETLNMNNIRVHQIEVEDGIDTDLYPFFQEAVQFICSALKKNENVFVHCAAGISRSPTIVAAYLMRRYKVTAQTAIAHIRTVRPIIEPKRNFVAQLELWETECLTPSTLEKLMWKCIV